MVLVKPATVVDWHRQGFRRYWRWRSSSHRVGRPGVNREIHDLIRQMSVANPLWSAPRIHGEMLKLGIEVSQATAFEGRAISDFAPCVESHTVLAAAPNLTRDGILRRHSRFLQLNAALNPTHSSIGRGLMHLSTVHFSVPNGARFIINGSIRYRFSGTCSLCAGSVLKRRPKLT
jgi:hypothetical protein